MGQKSMSNTVRLTLYANAGVCVEYRGIKLLIDGLFAYHQTGFSNLPESLLCGMLNHSGPGQDMDYLLFTHFHPDHYSSELTREYIRNNQVKHLFLPENDYKLQELLIKNRYSYTVMNSSMEACQTFQIEPDMTVTAFPSIHMGEKYLSVIHYCYILTLGEKSVLFTSDADYTESNFADALNGRNINTVLVNPLFINNKSGRDLIESVIKPKEVGIYHIPFIHDDCFGLQKIVSRDIKRNQQATYTTFALWDQALTKEF